MNCDEIYNEFIRICKSLSKNIHFRSTEKRGVSPRGSGVTLFIEHLKVKECIGNKKDVFYEQATGANSRSGDIQLKKYDQIKKSCNL